MSRQERQKRRLAAILAADVVGSSMLIEADEQSALAAIQDVLSEVLGAKAERHRGRLIKTMGDGALYEFASPVEAVACAVAVQETVNARTSAASGDLHVLLRIGINLGDVVAGDGGDLFGDGVNVAVRLEGIADPGGIAVSGKVYDELQGKLALEFEDRGEQHLKNIARPIRVYAFRGTAPGSREAPRPSLPDKPSIAVLPFMNMSGDPEQEYFADGITEDLITALSHIRWLFVIARNSAFAFKGRALDVKEVARQLGVRYVLEGSVRKAGIRVRITGQLIEAATGAHIWADRYDRDLTDIFDMQDEITENVVAVIEPTILRAEMDRAKRKRPDDMGAYDLYLRALAHMYEIKPEGRAAALKLIEQALDVEPDYAEAHGVAAWCYFAKSLWEGSLPAPHKEAMLRHARAVQELQPEDASTLAHAAIALALGTRDYDAALAMIDRAIAINPSSAHAHGHGSVINTWSGNYEKSIALSDRALRLSPLDPLRVMPLAGQAGAWMMKGEYQKGLVYADRALHVYPTHTPSFLIRIVCLSRLGRKEEARTTARRFVEVSPTYRIIPHAPVLEHFCDELREAGLPG